MARRPILGGLLARCFAALRRWAARPSWVARMRHARLIRRARERGPVVRVEVLPEEQFWED